MRTVRATRYVTPLREGGSLPAIVEADDLGLYVLKFRGAGQGPLALVAELISGEIGRLLGLNVPELAFINLDAAIGRNEPDEEVRDLLKASTGLNLAVDYLPGSLMFDPAASDTADAGTASRGVWFDAYITNVDRTARNPNLLCWHRSLYFIDHGATLYFHHNWTTAGQIAESGFSQIRDHILLPWAANIREIDPEMRTRLTPDALNAIVQLVPDEWLTPGMGTETPDQKRSAYFDYLVRRLNTATVFVEEALRAHAQLL